MCYLIAALERKQLHTVLIHFFFHIGPGRKYTLAPGILTCVKRMIQYFKSQMRHCYFVCVGKAKSPPHINFIRVLHHRIKLAARISCRLHYARKYFISQCYTHLSSPVFFFFVINPFILSIAPGTRSKILSTAD